MPQSFLSENVKKCQNMSFVHSKTLLASSLTQTSPCTVSSQMNRFGQFVFGLAGTAHDSTKYVVNRCKSKAVGKKSKAVENGLNICLKLDRDDMIGVAPSERKHEKS